MAEGIATVGDLAGICGHDGTDWLKVKTDANGYLYVVGTGTAGAIEVTQDTPGDLLVGQHQYDGTNWRKSNLLWGYNDRWAERATNLNATVGTNNLSTTAVPAGYVYWVAAARMLNNTSAITSYRLELLGDGVAVPIELLASPAAAESLLWSGGLPLKEDDVVRAIFYGCVAGDDLYLDVWGYMMKIDM